MASITDQWGNTLASRGAFYRTSHEDGCTVLTGLVTHDGMQRLTRHINVKVTRIGDVGGPWEFRVPVSYEQAAAREREVEIGVISDETAGVRLEVASVQLHATETVITYIYHGLQGGSAEIRHRADSYWRIPDLYTADGRRVLPISARPADDRPGDPLAIRVSYEPLPSDVVQLRVVDEAVGRCYSSPPYDPAPSGPTVSFSFSVSGDGSDRVLEPASPRAVELWDTVVEVREAFIDDGRVTITIRGTGGDLVRVVAWMLTDDQDRSLSLDELLPGHIMEPGINFEITYTYSIDDEVQTLELTLHDLLRRIPGPWEVQFSLPR